MVKLWGNGQHLRPQREYAAGRLALAGPGTGTKKRPGRGQRFLECCLIFVFGVLLDGRQTEGKNLDRLP